MTRDLLISRLQESRARRSPLARSTDTTAFRMVNGEADGLSDVTVDWFDGVAVVSLYRKMPSAEEALIVSSLAEVLSPKALYLKRRPKEARLSAKAQKELAPERPALGEPVDALTVLENGLSHLIRPAQGLSVGLYLDAREVRAWVRKNAKDATVLNCFAYTCAFAVSAGAGGARRTLNLDLSRRALRWGEENATLNGQAVNERDYLAGDVFEWLPRLARRSEPFQMVILDPPSFATSKRHTFSAASGYGELVDLACPLVAHGGTLLACCNLASLAWPRFEAVVEGSLKRAARRAVGVGSFRSPPLDFPTLPGHEPPLKALALRLD